MGIEELLAGLGDKVEQALPGTRRRVENAWFWLEDAYKENAVPAKQTAVSFGVAFLSGTAATAIADATGATEAQITGIATGADMGGFWTTFLAQEAYNDQDVRDDDGKFSFRRLRQKMPKYLGVMGLGEVVYAGTRAYVHYKLMKDGYNPELSSVAGQALGAGAFLGIFPVIKKASEDTVDYVANQLTKVTKYANRATERFAKYADHVSIAGQLAAMEALGSLMYLAAGSRLTETVDPTVAATMPTFMGLVAAAGIAPSVNRSIGNSLRNIYTRRREQAVA